jgi:peptidoglycan biosynthesis protein MviN/MurJ (putative lipid II flippase)
MGGARVTLAGVVLVVLIAAATLLAPWVVQRVIARGFRLAGLTRPGPVAVASAWPTTSSWAQASAWPWTRWA